MRMQNEQKAEKHANYQDNAKISSNLNSFNQEDLARGVGFEPTRPLLTTGLAGLPPTRLGQPRPVFHQPRRVLQGLHGCFGLLFLTP